MTVWRWTSESPEAKVRVARTFGLERHHKGSRKETACKPRLMKFAGQEVTVTGKVFERSGSRALVIERIEVETARK